jgi:hypothetical protein
MEGAWLEIPVTGGNWPKRADLPALRSGLPPIGSPPRGSSGSCQRESGTNRAASRQLRAEDDEL